MRSIAVLIIGLSLSATARAEEKTHSLSKKDVQDGWIMLFDGATTFGWNVEGDAKVIDGVLHLGGGTKTTKLTTTGEFGRGTVRWSFRHTGLKRAKMTWRTEERSLSASDKPNWVTETYEPGPGGVTPIQILVPPLTELEIRQFDFQPAQMELLFNGRDLTGWKRFDDGKRNKSVFSVTSEGWLNVKNGPGDLQTEKQFADFVLQLECISNGKNLNSGIFFRCLPGDYQQGYEAQIHNGFKDNDRAKPIDFGTGAIYRRQPARRVVPSDNEWFSMTVIAHRNRLTTWVNGYQTADFLDERAPNANARNGCKTDAGAISIQGHDPTTDLSFRNLRIAELK